FGGRSSMPMPDRAWLIEANAAVGSWTEIGWPPTLAEPIENVVAGLVSAPLWWTAWQWRLLSLTAPPAMLRTPRSLVAMGSGGWAAGPGARSACRRHSRQRPEWCR